MEVVGTHVPNANPGAWVAERLPSTWERADVLGTGHVAAERIPVCLREILDNNPILGFGL